MIEIQPFIDKLELLREYMNHRIDNQSFEMWMDLQVCTDDYYIDNNLPFPKPYLKTVRFACPTFDEFIKHKNN